MHKVEQVEMQWDILMGLINTHITGERKDKLIKMYELLADRVCTAPASSHSDRHNCWPGGYIDHVIRVTNCALKLYEVWTSLGANTLMYTKEELVFAAINHDLGKIGSKTEEYYIPNDSDWHVKRGQIYKINGKLNFMKVPERSIFTLQEHQIEMSENEYLAIKLHDGLYGKGNESYFMPGQSDFALKTDLPILLHHADHLATLIEGNIHHTTETVEVETTKKIKSKLTNVNDPVADSNLKSAFDQIFG